jgi:ketosteroid isomerase-like protein
MKSILMVAVLTITVCSSVFGEPKDRSDKQGRDVEQTVMRIEKEMLDALLKGDVSASERYIAETYVFTGPDGLVQDKAQSIADVKSGDLKLQSASLDDPKVRVYGDTAIVTYGSNDKGTYKGKDISGKTRWTDVFVKRNGRWQLVSGHGSRVAQQ